MYKNPKHAIWNLLLIILLTLAIYGFLFVKFKNVSFHALEVGDLLLQPLLLVFIVLWVAQFFIEAVKWKVLVNSNQPLTLSQSFRSILTGYAVSLLTPGRIGEWFGRSATITKQRVGITYLATAGSFLQTFIIILFAVPALLINYQNLPTTLFSTSTWLLVVGGFLCILLIVAIAFKKLIKKQKYVLIAQLQVFKKMRRSTIVTVSLLTALRYTLFSLQFALLLFMLGGVSYLTILSIIPVYYFFITLFPVISFLEPGIRLSAAFILFEPIGLTADSLTISVLIIWVFNLIIPSVIGSTLLYKLKIIGQR